MSVSVCVCVEALLFKWLSSIKTDAATRVRIQNEPVGFSSSVKIFGKVMNPTIPFPPIDKL